MQRDVTGRMSDVRQFWQVGMMRNAACFYSLMDVRQTRKVSSEERAGADARPPKMSQDFAPRYSERAVQKPKSLKHQGFAAFLRVRIVFRGLAGAEISTRCETRGSAGVVPVAETLAVLTGSATMLVAWRVQGFRAL